MRSTGRRPAAQVVAGISSAPVTSLVRPQQRERPTETDARRDGDGVTGGFGLLLSVVLVFVQLGMRRMQLHLFPVGGQLALPPTGRGVAPEFGRVCCFSGRSLPSPTEAQVMRPFLVQLLRPNLAVNRTPAGVAGRGGHLVGAGYLTR